MYISCCCALFLCGAAQAFMCFVRPAFRCCTVNKLWMLPLLLQYQKLWWRSPILRLYMPPSWLKREEMASKNQMHLLNTIFSVLKWQNLTYLSQICIRLSIYNKTNTCCRSLKTLKTFIFLKISTGSQSQELTYWYWTQNIADSHFKTQFNISKLSTLSFLT